MVMGLRRGSRRLEPFTAGIGRHGIEWIAKVDRDVLPLGCGRGCAERFAMVTTQSVSVGQPSRFDRSTRTTIISGTQTSPTYFYLWLRRSQKLVFPDLFAQHLASSQIRRAWWQRRIGMLVSTGAERFFRLTV